MNAPSIWKYITTGLFAILSVFVLATFASIVFLSYTLLKLDALIMQSGQTVGTALVLQDLLINLDEAESATRAFVISGKQEYKDSYEQSAAKVPANLATIQANDQLNLSDTQTKEIKALTEARLKVLKQTVEVRSMNDQETTRTILANSQGVQIMKQIREKVNAISRASQREIGPRQEQSHNYLQRALGVASVLVVFVLGICAAISWYFQRAILRERALEGTKSEFLSLASHQLRTPATNVKQYIGLLMDGYLGDLTDKQREALDIAYKNNESEIRIMNDLLDVAKLDLKRIHLHKQSVNIVSLVRQVLKSYAPYAAEHNLTLKFKAPPELYAPVDRGYFKGVIENLVDNAVKYSPDNTRIVVKIRADTQRGMFEVIVRDRGLGIKKRDITKLFMKFSRLTNDFSANTEGSGLGLYWVKEIMALHGGSVKAVSQEGQGSKFTVRAPLK